MLTILSMMARLHYVVVQWLMSFSLLHQNAAKKREQEPTEGENTAPPRKIARTDNREPNEAS